MKAKVILRDRNIPARREAEFVEDEDYQGGGYFEFECDDDKADTRRLSFGYVKANPNHFEIE